MTASSDADSNPSLAWGPWPGWKSVAEAARAVLTTKECQSALDHWCAVGGAERPPRRQALDPLEIRTVLPYLYLIDLEADGALRYRLAGEEVLFRHPDGLIGRALHEIAPEKSAPRIVPYFRECPERPAIVVVSGLIYHERERPGFGERLLLPLLDAESGSRGILGVTVQRRMFDDEALPNDATGRTRYVLPLDGSAPTVKEGV